MYYGVNCPLIQERRVKLMLINQCLREKVEVSQSIVQQLIETNHYFNSDSFHSEVDS